jgi:hypothetical protein
MYAQLIWERLGEVVTQYLNSISRDYVPRVEISQLNVIYNVPHLSVLLYISDKLCRNAFLILIQEVKRDIVDRWMNLPPSAAQVANPLGLLAHVESTLHRLQSYFQYIGLAKFGEAIEMIQQMKNLNLDVQ